MGALLKVSSGQPRLPTGYFILLPSHGSTMLLKAVATNELLLPTDFNQSGDEPTTETSQLIGASLDLVSTIMCEQVNYSGASPVSSLIFSPTHPVHFYLVNTANPLIRPLFNITWVVGLLGQK